MPYVTLEADTVCSIFCNTSVLFDSSRGIICSFGWRWRRRQRKATIGEKNIYVLRKCSNFESTTPSSLQELNHFFLMVQFMYERNRWYTCNCNHPHFDFIKTIQLHLEAKGKRVIYYIMDQSIRFYNSWLSKHISNISINAESLVV